MGTTALRSQEPGGQESPQQMVGLGAAVEVAVF